MEYKKEDIYRMVQTNPQKMPFYMAYPMQNVFLEEAEYERDMERLKSFYPQEVRNIQRQVDEECDKMEYEGSMMFDEYPDRLMMKQITDRICRNVADQSGFEAEQYELLEAEELRMVGPGRPHYNREPDFRPPIGKPRPPQQDWNLRNLVEVMLYQEMYNRRCRHKRCRRWW